MMMSQRVIRWLFSLLLCSSVVGCRKEGGGDGVSRAGTLVLRPGVHQTNEVVRYYKDLPPDGVLVQVGGRKLTRTGFQEAVDEWLAFRQKKGPWATEQDEKRLELEAFNFVFANFMARAAMLEEATARSIQPKDADLKDAENFINQLCGRMRVKRSEFANRFSGGETAVACRIREEATLKALLREQFGSLFDVSDSTAQALKTELERRRQESLETNKVFFATLSRVREQVVSGELKLTDDRTAMQAAMPAGVTFDGVVSNNGFDLLNLPKACQALAILKPGEWSPVVELEETFELYQLRAVEPNEDKDLIVYTFIKITVPRDLGWEVPEIAQLKRNIARSRRNEKQAPWVLGLITKAGVLYPNGVQLFGPSIKKNGPKTDDAGKASNESATKEKK